MSYTITNVTDLFTEADGSHHDGIDAFVDMSANGGIVAVTLTPVDDEGDSDDERAEHFHALVLPRTSSPLAEVLAERQAQDAKWNEQNHPDGTRDDHFFHVMADQARQDCQQAAREGKVTWFHILREEFWEAMVEVDPAKLRGELLQIAAVATAWVEAIDRRTAAAQGGGS